MAPRIKSQPETLKAEQMRVRYMLLLAATSFVVTAGINQVWPHMLARACMIISCLRMITIFLKFDMRNMTIVIHGAVHAVFAHAALMNELGTIGYLHLTPMLLLWTAIVTPKWFTWVSIISFATQYYMALMTELHGVPLPTSVEQGLWHVVEPRFLLYIAMIVVIAAHITLHRMTNDLLQASVKKHELLQERRDSFLANTTHELRSPMTAIFHLTELLLSPAQERNTKPLLLSLRSSCRALMKFLNQVLDLSHTELGGSKMMSFSIQTVVRDSMSVFLASARLKNISMQRGELSSIPDYIKSDPFLIKKVLLNLVSNAIKFTPTGSVTVNVGVRPGSGSQATLILEVIDTGVGMSTVEGVLEPYFLAERKATHVTYATTGLGLAVCKAAMDQLDGTIHVESKPMAGTTFRIEVPVEIVRERSKSPPSVMPEPAFDVSTENSMEPLSAGLLDGIDPDDGSAPLQSVQLAEEMQAGVTHLTSYMSSTTQDSSRVGGGHSSTSMSPGSERSTHSGAGFSSVDHRPMGLMERAERKKASATGSPGGSGAGVGSPVTPTRASTDQLPYASVLGGTPSLTHEDSVSTPTAATPTTTAAGVARQLSQLSNQQSVGTLSASSLSVSSGHGSSPGPVEVPIKPRKFALLLVEDTDVIRRVVRMTLVNKGHTCSTAENGLAGFDAVVSSWSSGHPFDAVLCDIFMPVMNGWEATAKIRAEEQRLGQAPVPIIAVTANNTAETRAACLSAGMNAIVEKPFETKVVLEAIASVVEGRDDPRFSLLT